MIPRVVSEYRPQPPPPEEFFARRKASNAFAASSGMEIDQSLFSAKKERSKVFTGRRNVFLKEVPSLFSSCLRVLGDNIDGLTYTGGVPFDILKPVLEKASPEQLFRIEDWNPYLVEDTDALWEVLCGRDFKYARREELESWREVYERMLQERERKLKKVTSSIVGLNRKAEAKTRHTILSVAKAPRDVQKKQEKFGTARPVAALSAEDVLERRRQIDSVANSQQNGATSLAVKRPGFANGTSGEGSGGPKKFKTIEGGARKKKVAPLMAKTLKMLKQARR